MKNVLLMLLAAGVLAGCALYLGGTWGEEAPSASELKKARLLAKDGPKPEHPGELAAYWASLHETPNGENPARLNWEAKQAIELSRAALGTPLPNFQFREVGPGNFGGRVRGVVHDGAGTLVIGGVAGGMWKSTDDGATWAPQDDFLPTLAIGSMLRDPDDGDIIWAGTGEGFFNVDSAQGLGIFRSTDFGDTWTQLPSTTGADFNYVNRIGRIPASSIVMAATRTGIHRSTDDGTTWAEVSGVTTSSRGFTDLQVDPSDTTRVFAYHYGTPDANRRVYRSTNSGASWTMLTNGLPTTNLSRMEIGIGSDGVVYVSISNSAFATRGLWRSTNGGTTFTQTASNTPFIERQGWYDLPIAVDPNDSDTVLMGAVDLFRTTDGGTTIGPNRLTAWNPGPGQMDVYVHADQHAIVYDGSSDIYSGSDGGIFKSTDGGDTWSSRNNDLRITQYYGIAVHPDGEQVIGGTQDNGSHLFFGDEVTWLEWFGGDGGFCAWDQQQPQFIYGSLPGGGVFGSADGGSTSAQMTLPDTTGALFIEPFTIDPNNGNRMIVGTDNVFYSANARNIATATFTDVSGALGGSVSATTISPHDGAFAYAGTVTGGVFETTGLGTGGSWTAIDSNLPGGSDITWIEVDPNDPTHDTLYVTLADYGADKVWRTTNGGASWESIHGDLPDIPMFAFRVDPIDPGRFWVGSELGLWTGVSGAFNGAGGGIDWEQYDYGPAFTRVVQIHWSGDDRLWIGTHGRSIYRGDRSPFSVEIGELDDATCDGDGSADNGETVFVPVSLTNNGGSSEGALVTLDGSDEFHFRSGTIDFGIIAPGATETRDFEVAVAIDSCLTPATLDVDIDWGEGTTTESFDLILGGDPIISTGTFTDGAEGATLMTSDAAVGVDDWGQVSTQANTGTMSFFTSDVEGFTDKSLFSPWFDALPGGNVLTFALFYNTEGDATQLWDGAVLELRTEGGDWVDIGQLSTVPYDGHLFNNNTIPFREAWSGDQQTWRLATVDLGTTYTGERIQFRFRMVCDTLTGAEGFWVDDISLTNVSWQSTLACDTSACEFVFADGFETGDTSRWQ